MGESGAHSTGQLAGPWVHGGLAPRPSRAGQDSPWGGRWGGHWGKAQGPLLQPETSKSPSAGGPQARGREEAG